MSDAPQRIQLKRTKGWRKPPNTVVVSRPSILGNPFVVLQWKAQHPTWSVIYRPNPKVDRGSGGFVDEFDTRAEAMQCAVDTYRDWATSGPNHYLRVQYFIDTHKLHGKNLACWCPLDQPCHADVLLELASDSYPHGDTEQEMTRDPHRVAGVERRRAASLRRPQPHVY